MISLAAGSKIQVLIGEDNQDWSAAYVSFSAGDPERDDSGQLPISGQLRLAVVANAPDTLDPRSSAGRLRWFKGQRVIINIQTSAGTYVRHPRGWFYLARPPLPPTPQNPYLDLELFCGLQLQTFPQPRGLAVGFAPDFGTIDPGKNAQPGNQLARTSAISTCLQKAGIPLSFVGSVPKHPVQIALNKDDPGGFVELAGKVAYGGCMVLQQTNQGEVTAYSAAIAANPPLVSFDLASVVSFEYVDGGEPPAEKIVFNGTYSLQVGTSESNTTTEVVIGDGGAIHPNLAGQRVIVREVTRSESTSPSQRRITETVRAPLTLISQAAYGFDTSMGLSSDSTKTWRYGLGGKLQSYSETETGLFPKICSGYFSGLKKAEQGEWLGVQSTITREIRYEYNGDVVKAIAESHTEPLAALDLGIRVLDQPNLPVPSFLEDKKWTSLRKNEWRYSRLKMIPRSRFKTDTVSPVRSVADKVAYYSALVEAEAELIISNSGQATPPAADRNPTKSQTEDRYLEGTALFQLPRPGVNFSPRERTYTLDVACAGSAQLIELAQIEGALLLGRGQGVRIQVPCSDVFLVNPAPFFNFELLETEILPTGKRVNRNLYQADGIEFIHEQDRSLVAMAGVWIGTQEGPLVPHSQTPAPDPFNSASVVAAYSYLELQGSQGTGAQADIVIPLAPLMAFHSHAGLLLGGLGRELPDTIGPTQMSFAGLFLGGQSGQAADIQISFAGLDIGGSADQQYLDVASQVSQAGLVFGGISSDTYDPDPVTSPAGLAMGGIGIVVHDPNPIVSQSGLVIGSQSN